MTSWLMLLRQQPGVPLQDLVNDCLQVRGRHCCTCRYVSPALWAVAALPYAPAAERVLAAQLHWLMQQAAAQRAVVFCEVSSWPTAKSEWAGSHCGRLVWANANCCV